MHAVSILPLLLIIPTGKYIMALTQLATTGLPELGKALRLTWAT